MQATVERTRGLARAGWRFFAISAGDYFLYSSSRSIGGTKGPKGEEEAPALCRTFSSALGSPWHFVVRNKIIARECALSDPRSRQ